VVGVAGADADEEEFTHVPSVSDVRVLLLGGTAEARALAAVLSERGVPFTSSLAGRVSSPALPVGDVRIGGFGGVDGLADYLGAESITHVVDATHPFAATITANAVNATQQMSLPLTVLRRPGWTQRPGDDWTRVADVVAAAQTVAAAAAGAVFLTTGRRDLGAFAADDVHHFLVRTVDPPTGATPPRMTLLLDRGPYRLTGERSLMRAHDVRLLVTKDSGGPLTVAKLDAARELGVPVVVVDRPPLPPGQEAVPTVADAVAQLSLG
jgi:precorrin-6A/cobalt-precorrin-6A reductase